MTKLTKKQESLLNELLEDFDGDAGELLGNLQGLFKAFSLGAQACDNAHFKGLFATEGFARHQQVSGF